MTLPSAKPRIQSHSAKKRSSLLIIQSRVSFFVKSFEKCIHTRDEKSRVKLKCILRSLYDVTVNDVTVNDGGQEYAHSTPNPCLNVTVYLEKHLLSGKL